MTHTTNPQTPPTPAAGPDHDADARREIAAGLRAFADYIEASPWLPVPYPATLQAGVPTDLTGPDRLAKLRTLAQLTGTAVVELSTGARETSLAFGRRLTYVIHAPADLAPSPSRARTEGGRRIVPEREDARQLAATAPEPTPATTSATAPAPAPATSLAPAGAAAAGTFRTGVRP